MEQARGRREGVGETRANKGETHTKQPHKESKSLNSLQLATLSGFEFYIIIMIVQSVMITHQHERRDRGERDSLAPRSSSS